MAHNSGCLRAWEVVVGLRVFEKRILIEEGYELEEFELDNEQKDGKNQLARLDRRRIHKKVAKYPIFDKEIDILNPKFRVSLVFEDVDLFRRFVHEYEIKNGKVINLLRNDLDRIRGRR